MKKILSFMLVILVMALLSAVVYWIGLPNLIITEDKITIIHTKTSGYELINHSDKLKWDPRKLLPNNYEVLYFSRSYQSFPLDIQIDLPQLDLIPDSIEINIHQEYIPKISINGNISFRVNDQHIIHLLESRKILPNQLDIFYQEQLQVIKDLLITKLMEINIQEIEFYLNSENISSLLIKNLYYMDIEYINIADITLINLEAYKNLNNDVSSSVLKNDEEILQNATSYIQILEKEQSLLEFRLELEKLEALGALLTKYPILLVYMVLSNEYPVDNPIASLFIQKYLSMHNLTHKDAQE